MEEVVSGNSRKLIIKNVGYKDACMYWCKSGDFKTAFKVTIRDPEKPQVVVKKVPLHFTEQKLKDELLLQARKRDVETKKRWIRSPGAWNTWMLNPVLMTSG